MDLKVKVLRGDIGVSNYSSRELNVYCVNDDETFLIPLNSGQAEHIGRILIAAAEELKEIEIQNKLEELRSLRF